MNALETRNNETLLKLAVLEEYFLLNYEPPYFAQGTPEEFMTYTVDDICKGVEDDDDCLKMVDIFHESLDKRYRKCGVCSVRIDFGTRHFLPPADYGKCPSCHGVLCANSECRHYSYKNSSERYLVGCTSCMRWDSESEDD